jgi:hypothetical protein
MDTITHQTTPDNPSVLESTEASWDAIAAGEALPESAARQTYRAALEAVTAKAKGNLPESHGRLKSAVTILLAGDLVRQPDGSARVSSQTSSKVYDTTLAVCACPDAERAPGGHCKHKLALMLDTRARQYATAQLDGETPVDDPEGVPQTPETPAPDDTGNIPREFVTTLHGRDFVLYGGLLHMAHARGLVKLTARFISVTADLALAEATAEFADGSTFGECGDATPGNVGDMVRPHFARMALTRAKCRCLRDALDIGMCSLEELA